jgi:hypothetical protein
MPETASPALGSSKFWAFFLRDLPKLTAKTVFSCLTPMSADEWTHSKLVRKGST